MNFVNKIVGKYLTVADDRRQKMLEDNAQKPKSVQHANRVKLAEKAANSGEAASRLIGIAKAVGDKKYEQMFTALKSVYEMAGHRPQGYDEMLDDLGSGLAYSLVSQYGFTKEDLEKVAWGLPSEELKYFGVSRVTKD